MNTYKFNITDPVIYSPIFIRDNPYKEGIYTILDLIINNLYENYPNCKNYTQNIAISKYYESIDDILGQVFSFLWGDIDLMNACKTLHSYDEIIVNTSEDKLIFTLLFDPRSKNLYGKYLLDYAKKANQFFISAPSEKEEIILPTDWL